jgi:hypothetical protein
VGRVAEALALYRTFNARQPDFVTALDVEFPRELARVGRARQILYRSDKWRSDGVATYYVHPYESEVDCLVRPEGTLERVVVRAWPTEAVQLGECIEVAAEAQDGGFRSVKPPAGTLLCATPDGRSLLFVHPRHGILGALTGGRQRITDRGVEG